MLCLCLLIIEPVPQGRAACRKQHRLANSCVIAISRRHFQDDQVCEKRLDAHGQVQLHLTPQYKHDIQHFTQSLWQLHEELQLWAEDAINCRVIATQGCGPSLDTYGTNMVQNELKTS